MIVDFERGLHNGMRRIQLAEVFVFLLLFVPSMVVGLFYETPNDLAFSIVAVSIILNELALLALVIFFVWRNGEGLSAIGWCFHSKWKEIFLGIILYFPFMIVLGLLETLLQSIGLTGPAEIPTYLIPSGAAELILAVVFLLVVAVAEESIFRGYLIRRFRNITGNPTVAVFMSSIVFALGHGYEGPLGVVTIAIVGILFALVYLWRGSLIAPVVMHFIQNFIGIIAIPLWSSSLT